MIIEKSVFINSEVAKLGTVVNTQNDTVIFKGKIINEVKKEYYIFYKPSGYICSRTKQGQVKTIYSLFENDTLKYAGRLDKDSEGLLLLSNDGDWINELTHPRYNVKKIYIVKTSSNIDKKNFDLKVNVGNDIYEILNLLHIGDREYRVVLTTGKNREIRKIFTYNNVDIISLKRIQMGKYKLGDMKPGDLIKLGEGGI